MHNTQQVKGGLLLNMALLQWKFSQLLEMVLKPCEKAGFHHICQAAEVEFPTLDHCGKGCTFTEWSYTEAAELTAFVSELCYWWWKQWELTDQC